MSAQIANLNETLIMIVSFFSPLAKTDIFHSVSSSNDQKNISISYMKHRHTMSLFLPRYRSNTSTDPLFVIYTRHPSSSDALCNPAWWTSTTGWEADLHRPRNEIGWPSLAGGVRTRPCALGVHPGQTGMGSPGRRPFLPGPLSPHPLPHPTSIARQWSECAGRALIQ